MPLPAGPMKHRQQNETVGGIIWYMSRGSRAEAAEAGPIRIEPARIARMARMARMARIGAEEKGRLSSVIG